MVSIPAPVAKSTSTVEREVAALTRDELREELFFFGLGTLREQLQEHLTGLTERLVQHEQAGLSGLARCTARKGAPMHSAAPQLRSQRSICAPIDAFGGSEFDQDEDDDEQHEWTHRHFSGFTAGKEQQPHRKRKKPPEQEARPGLLLAATPFASSSTHQTPKILRSKTIELGCRPSEQPVVLVPGQVLEPSLAIQSLHAAQQEKLCAIAESTDEFLDTSKMAPPIVSFSEQWPASPTAEPPTLETDECESSDEEPELTRKHSVRRLSSVFDEGLTCSERAGLLIRSHAFDYTSGALVIANAITLGYQTDYMARNVEVTSPPLFLRILELFFCIIFTLEIALRMASHGCDYFIGVDLRWNIFDFVLVAMQVLEEIVLLLLSNGFSKAKAQEVISNLTVLRVLRVLRLVRIVRLVRVMRHIGELRTLVTSIVASMRSLGWACLLLFLSIYILAVFYTQVVSDQRRLENLSLIGSDLIKYYGSLDLTILSLFEAVTGGVDWDDAMQPLVNISPWLGFVFTIYVAFVLLAMMNVVTGVFTETALLSAKKDKDVYIVNHVKELFHSLDLSNSGLISWCEIEEQMDTPLMQEYFEAIGVDASEAQNLFRLLDLNDTGAISSDDFLNGCMRIRGNARAIDSLLLLRETSRMGKQMRQQTRELGRLSEMLFAEPPLRGDTQVSCTSAPTHEIAASAPHVRELSVPAQAPPQRHQESASLSSTAENPACHADKLLAHTPKRHNGPRRPHAEKTMGSGTRPFAPQGDLESLAAPQASTSVSGHTDSLSCNLLRELGMVDPQEYPFDEEQNEDTRSCTSSVSSDVDWIEGMKEELV